MTTVMLSLPPRSLASSTRPLLAVSPSCWKPGAELVGALEVAREAVAREEEVVAWEHLEHERVDVDALVDADRARDRVLVADLLDLLLRQLAALDELVEDGVVFRDLLNDAAALEVDAAVADVRDEPARPEDEQRGDRRAHAALLRIGLRLFVDARARALDRVLHQREHVLVRDARGAARAGHEVVQEVALALDLLVDRTDGDGARDLACGVAAHAVGDHEERELLVDEEVVLIVLANAPHVGRGEKADGFRRHMTRESSHDAA